MPERAAAGFLAALILAGCGGEGAPGPGAGTATPNAPPTRIVVIGPATAENVFALGAGARLAGVSDWCVAPEAADLPRVGGLSDPNLERIARLQPDLVLAQGRIEKVESWCALQGVPFHSFLTDSWAGWEEETRALGRLLDLAGPAEALIAGRAAALAALRAESPPDAARPSVLIVISRRAEDASGLVVAGGASFLSELVEAAGGRNLCADSPRDYFDLGEEALLKDEPDFVFEIQPPAGNSLAAWQRSFPELAAVKAGRVFAFAQDFIALPGPRMVETARLFRQRISG